MTDETRIRAFLGAFRRASLQIGLYPPEHPLTEEGMRGAIAEVEQLTAGGPEVVLAIREDGLFLDGLLLPHISLEFDSLLHEMRARDVASITFTPPVSHGDLFDLAAFVARSSDDLPAEGSIRLNETPMGEGGRGVSRLRRSYTDGLASLRMATDSMAREGAFDLRSVMGAVEGLIAGSLEDGSAALLLSTVKSHDEYTFYHSVNTCILALALGKAIGLTPEELMPIGTGALLHDIGKTAVRASTLNHPGQLDAEAWSEVETHPQEGAQAILAGGGLGHEVAAMVAMEHHVRFDGGGYPHGYSVDHKPHLFSSLVSVVDVYDALTTRRRYRRAATPNGAMRTLVRESGAAHHPDLVRALVGLMGVYPIGSIVRVAGGESVVVTGHDGSRQIHGVIAISAEGERVEPEPLSFSFEDVIGQVLPDAVGLDPASLLEAAGVEEQLSSGQPSEGVVGS
ncbi:MAG: HD domain-containing protein [Acidimicrobiia bacterium]|nr:HD domain-containing protein [Acidimicrobiia bacterium]